MLNYDKLQCKIVCSHLQYSSLYSFPLRKALRRMPFLPQPYPFFRAWYRHQKTLECAPDGRCLLYKAFIRPFLPMLPQVGRLFVNITSQHNSTNCKSRLILTIGYIPLFESNRSLRIIWFYANLLRF